MRPGKTVIMTLPGIAESDSLAQLLELTKAYCKSRNLDHRAYAQGLMNKGPLNPTVVEILIRNHQEWLS